MEKKINLKISKTWSFNNKVAKVFDVHVNQSIPMYKEFHKQPQITQDFLSISSNNVYTFFFLSKIEMEI